MNVGLVGWAVRTGIGMQNRDLWDAGAVSRWLVPKHPLLNVDPVVAPKDALLCEGSGYEQFEKFITGLDAVLFIEHPFLASFDVMQEIHERGVIACCVPNMEWLPLVELSDWVREVDVMWAPTEWTRRELTKEAQRAHSVGQPCRWENRIYGGRWGVDLERFKFRERTTCKRLLYCNGNGGAGNRKGIYVIAEAARLVPEVQILVRSQTAELPRLPPNVKVVIENSDERWGIYDDGDVLLAPSRWEGLGLQHYEAQACGLPVVTTDGDPMREAGPVKLINCQYTSWVSLCGREITTYEADPVHLAAIMKTLVGRNISVGSRNARAYVEGRHEIRDVCRELTETLVEVAGRRKAA